MKRALILALAVVLTTLAAVERAAAQRMEMGVRAGVASQNMEMKFDGLQDARARLGWHAALVSRIRIIGFGGDVIGAGFFFQPEIVYSQNNLKANVLVASSTGGGLRSEPSKIRMQSVDVPLLLSLKVSILRVQAGPVFNLMNNFSTVSGDLEINPHRAAVGYAIGASIDLLGLTIDGRYHGEFKELKNNIDGGSGIRESVRGSLSSWSLGVGIMF